MADAPQPCIAGSSMQHVRSAVAQLYGEAVAARGLAALPPEARRAIEHATPLGWVPAEVLAAAIDAWSLEAGVTAEELTIHTTRIATRDAFATIWRIFLRMSSDESLIARTALIYSKTRNVGRLSVEHAAPGTARLRLRGWPTVTDRQLVSIATSIETILALTGREHPHARTRRVDGDALFELRWARRR